MPVTQRDTIRDVPAAVLDDYLQIGQDVRANLERRIDWLTSDVEAAEGDEHVMTWDPRLGRGRLSAYTWTYG